MEGFVEFMNLDPVTEPEMQNGTNTDVENKNKNGKHSKPQVYEWGDFLASCKQAMADETFVQPKITRRGTVPRSTTRRVININSITTMEFKIERLIEEMYKMGMLGRKNKTSLLQGVTEISRKIEQPKPNVNGIYEELSAVYMDLENVKIKALKASK